MACVRTRASLGREGPPGRSAAGSAAVAVRALAVAEAESWLLTTTSARGSHLVMAAPVASPKSQLRMEGHQGHPGQGLGAGAEEVVNVSFSHLG